MVSVPATIMQSDCRGLGRKMIPNLSKSYRAAPVCIISTAQHASPNVMGQMDPVRAQFMSESTLERTNSAPAPPFDVVLDVGAFNVVDAINAGPALVCTILLIASRDAACAALGKSAIATAANSAKTNPSAKSKTETKWVALDRICCSRGRNRQSESSGK